VNTVHSNLLESSPEDEHRVARNM